MSSSSTSAKTRVLACSLCVGEVSVDKDFCKGCLEGNRVTCELCYPRAATVPCKECKRPVGPCCSKKLLGVTTEPDGLQKVEDTVCNGPPCITAWFVRMKSSYTDSNPVHLCFKTLEVVRKANEIFIRRQENLQKRRKVATKPS
jgi:hypothetical protein